jgi:4-azaleucine resistance transporter AzlC
MTTTGRDRQDAVVTERDPPPCRQLVADAANRTNYRAGVRAALPLVIPVAALGASFGIAARGLHWGAVAPVAMSIIVFSGSAQFAVASVLGGGGSVAAAILAAALVNARFLPMGVAAAPATRGGVLRRALEGQVVVDASWALAMRDGMMDRGMLFGATLPQFVGWTAGTALGVAFGGAIGDPLRLGLDALFPAFFLTLLVEEVRGQGRLTVGLLGAAIAFGLIPFVPPGLPVIGASCGALLGLRRR